jgi:hypothetical protein
MSSESVALTPECAEFGAVWLPEDELRWQAHLGIEEHLDEPAEVGFYCLHCAERESAPEPNGPLLRRLNSWA